MAEAIRKRSGRARDTDLTTIVFRTLPQLGRLAQIAVSAIHERSAGAAPSFVRQRTLWMLLGGPLRTGELASRCAMSAPAVTEIVDALERDGYVRRIDDPTDRRVVLVELTERGRAETTRAKALVGERLDAALSHLSALQRARLRAAFLDLELALQRELDHQDKQDK